MIASIELQELDVSTLGAPLENPESFRRCAQRIRLLLHCIIFSTRE